MLAAVLIAVLTFPAGNGYAQNVDKATELYQSGRFKEAAAMLAELGRKQLGEPGLHVMLGKAYLKLH